MTNPPPEYSDAVCRFGIKGGLIDLVPLLRGHIHDTFVSTWSLDGEETHYLHQRLNDRVFTDIPGLMHNVERVTRHLHETADQLPADMIALNLIPTNAGHSFLHHKSGRWRTYNFVDDSESYDLCESEEMAYEAARAFGSFQACLLGLRASDLRETIPKYFSSPHRLQQLNDACEADAIGRVEVCSDELAFVGERIQFISTIEDCLAAERFPSRIVHGDTKLNNVMFDNTTRRARCVVDLDTCMPGYSLYDFGDLVRFTAASSAEDEVDLSLAGIDMALYKALVRGYLEDAESFLTPDEVELMPLAARLVTLTIGMRFLADYLAGDTYFKTSREQHNLERARVQFEMVRQMEARKDEMSVV